MPYTSNRNYYYPAKGTKPYFLNIETTFDEIDADIQSIADANIFAAGTGTLSSVRIGSGNTVAGDYSFAAGKDNSIDSSCTYTSVLGYNNNLVSSYASFVTGENTTVGGTTSIVVAANSSIDGSYILAVGSDHLCNNGVQYGTMLGSSNTITNGSSYMLLTGRGLMASSGSSCSMMVGKYSIATNGVTNTIISGTNAYAYSNRSGLITSSGHPVNNDGETATAGEAQSTVAMNFVGRTIDATVTDFGETAGGGGHPLLVNHAYTVQALITAKCTSGTSVGGMKSWIQEFAVNHNGTTAVIVDSAERTMGTVVGNEADWVAEFIIYNEGFFLQATGHADDNINWHASFTSSEVGITTS